MHAHAHSWLPHRQALLTSCPELASRNESDILERILAEMAVAELVESFGGGQYETIADLNRTNFLYNLWWVTLESRVPRVRAGWMRQVRGSEGICRVAHLHWSKCREATFNFTSKTCSAEDNYNEIVLFGTWRFACTPPKKLEANCLHISY